MLAAYRGCVRNVRLILDTQAKGSDSEAKGGVNLDLLDNKVVTRICTHDNTITIDIQAWMHK